MEGVEGVGGVDEQGEAVFGVDGGVAGWAWDWKSFGFHGDVSEVLADAWFAEGVRTGVEVDGEVGGRGVEADGAVLWVSGGFG